MNILIIQPFLSWGGAEAVSIQFANVLNKSGHRAKIICLYKTPLLPLGADKIKIVTPPRFVSDLFKNHKSLIIVLGFFVLLLLTINNSKKADMVNPHNFPSLWVAVITARIRKVPVIWTVHNFPQSPFPALTFLDKFFARQCKSIVAVSEKVGKQIFKKYKVRSKIIYPGIDYTYWSGGKKIKRYGNNFVVVTAGRLKKDKNFDLAIEAFKIVSKNLKNAVLIIVGEGIEFENIKQTAKNIENVKLIGYQTPAQLRDWYKTASLFVLPSYKTEGFNLTPFEALCSAITPLVVKGSGADEAILKNKIGIVSGRSAGEVSEAIYWVYKNQSNAYRMAKKGKLWVKNNLSWEEYVKRFQNLI